MGVNGCLIGLQPYRVANIVAQGNRPPELASGFHTNFRMEKLDAHQKLRLLRRAVYTPTVNFHAKLTRRACGQKLGLSEEIVHVHIRRQDASG